LIERQGARPAGLRRRPLIAGRCFSFSGPRWKMTNANPPQLCWICAAVATTREHTTNNTIIRIVWADCNNRRTRSHDAAVQQLARWLIKQNPRLVPGNCISPHAVYAQQTAGKMLDLHLYLAKKFGCLVKQAHAVGQQLPLALSAASKAIMIDAVFLSSI
jgi:hypothetical protein